MSKTNPEPPMFRDPVAPVPDEDEEIDEEDDVHPDDSQRHLVTGNQQL